MQQAQTLREEQTGNVAQQTAQQTDRVQIIYYTDPLCCWSWAFESQWRKLVYTFRDFISYRYCMSGMIADWKNYQDAVNSVSRPIQMGPVWMEAHHVSGMPFYDLIWIKDPPASSYPACVAVKCAEKQSAKTGELYLRALREALMLDGQNIAKKEVLLQVAETLKSNINIQQFEQDLLSGAAIQAFKKDIAEVNYRNITRFPTLTISYQQKGVMFTGYRPYQALLEAFAKIAPHIHIQNEVINKEDYLAYWPTLTERELKEIENV